MQKEVLILDNTYNQFNLYWNIIAENMRKYIRILESPIYLLIIAMACFEMEAVEISIFLIIVSAVRFYINVITDSSVYK